MKRRGPMGAVAAAATLVAALTGGCSQETRQKVLPYLFDGFSAGPPKAAVPRHRMRRDLEAEIARLERELAAARATARALQEQPTTKAVKLPAEQTDDWAKIAALLPKDTAGRVDWVEALKDGAINPRASWDPRTPAQAVLDLDVPLEDAVSKAFHVVYPHAPHTTWLACGNCHPSIFPLGRKASPTVITMTKIRAGQYCGRCHGKVAFPVDGECHRCHKAIPARSAWQPEAGPLAPLERARHWNDAEKLLPVTLGVPDWVKALEDGLVRPRPGIDPQAEEEPVLPLDVELEPKDNPAFKAVFPHVVHTAWLACTSCHPGIFQMARGADPITMEKVFAGQYCGRCHGKVAFPLTACGRCHPLLAGGK